MPTWDIHQQGSRWNQQLEGRETTSGGAAVVGETTKTSV